MTRAKAALCWNLSLQAGVLLMSVTYFTVCSAMIFVNLADVNSSSFLHPLNLVSMLAVAAGMLVVAVFGFLSAYHSSSTAALVDGVLFAVLLCFWCVLSLLSMFGTTSVCIRSRCPESLWLAERSWAKGIDMGVKTTTTTQPPTVATPAPVRLRPEVGTRFDGYYYPHYVRGVFVSLPFQLSSHSGKIILREELEAHGDYDYAYLIAEGFDIKNKNTDYLSAKTEYGIPLVGSVVLFLVNFGLLFYGMLAVCRWRRVIKHKGN